ncbi:L,D-transpeptidase [Chitinispirillales bacterium ANBcel5]|uniref:L,D-transpeptidase family protein n=1 Tax=Cellulosispirillum alkaliphilum TaxID=3039283 RepID=UPI002A5890A2|nr:L,D-transpeptidase [Chitinispirillales bacterium ANBcel5]
MKKNREQEIRKSLLGLLPSIPDQCIDINLSSQEMCVTLNDGRHLLYPVSSSRFGIGNEEGSLKTPTGVHSIIQKIGAGSQPGTIFKSRKNTGMIWKPGMDEENMILSRILRLKGLEPGKNSGPGIDSYDRYIYIHGTNREQDIGTPLSHGCICMRNADIVELFDIIEENTIVYIG